MQFGKPLSVTTPSDTEIVIQRGFAALPHLVYACYTQPALIRRWLTGPDGWTMPVCSYEARPGGTYRFEWHGPNNDFLAVSGTIDSIDAPSLIDAQEVFDGEVMGPPYRSQVAFVQQDQSTLATTRLTYVSRAHRDMVAATGMAEGMEMSFSKLDAVLGELD
jgi:uncharacterized protein YndB with AHSA1/START domain